MTTTLTTDVVPIAAWRWDGACLTADPDLFFYADGERGVERAQRDSDAKKVCSSCPVLDKCQAWALATRQPYGVWGGMTEDERAAAVRRRRRAVTA